MKLKSTIIAFFIPVVIFSAGTERIVNFTSPKTIYDFEFAGNIIWVGTSGGLFNYNLDTKEINRRSCTPSFPDPSIRALAYDEKGNLWVASDEGYLLSLKSDGSEYINNSYIAADWHISDIMRYDKYLIVASSKGVSLFDVEKKIVVKNASKIGSFLSSQIYTIAIHENRLYVGGESGSARLKGTIDKIGSLNFYDPTIWQVDTTIKPVHTFVPIDEELKAFSTPAGYYFEKLLTADSATMTVHVDSPYTVTFRSTITTIKVDRGIRCLIGTEEDYWAFMDAEQFFRVEFAGPTFASANRVEVDRQGHLWVLPFGIPDGLSPYYPIWWVGINEFDGSFWKNHSPYDSSAAKANWHMGHMGLSTESYTIYQTKDDNVWFGFKGGSIKCYDPAEDDWTHYCNFGMAEGNGTFIKVKGHCPESDWGKCDVITQDSAGYMWISSWNNFAGCLICYKPDPEESDSLTLNGERLYRRFPPYGSISPNINISALVVDHQQNIIYGTDAGDLTIAHYEGDPIKDPNNFKIRKTFTDLSKIFQAVVLPDGTTLIISVSGVYWFNPDDLTLELREEFDKNITNLAVESESIYWYTVDGEGLTRYDLAKDEKTIFNRSQGLISDEINDICVDKVNGYIWVATNRGISRVALGYSARSSTIEEDVVYPNPFSFRRHKTIYFQRMPRNGTLRVYSLNGNLIKVPNAVRSGDDGAYYQWTPPSNLSPGTYFYVIVSPTIKKTGRIIITP